MILNRKNGEDDTEKMLINYFVSLSIVYVAYTNVLGAILSPQRTQLGFHLYFPTIIE